MGTAVSALETCEEAPRKKSWAKSCFWGLWVGEWTALEGAVSSLGCQHWPAGAQVRALVTASIMNCRVQTTPKFSDLKQQWRCLLVIVCVDDLGQSFLGSCAVSWWLGRTEGLKLASNFHGGPVVKTLHGKAQNVGLIPGPGRFHMPWGN